MINQLASPSICVIDNEAEEYGPILAALNSLFVSAVHIVGTIESLPPEPFKRLRLVFVDLHLTAAIGKDAASHTANVFIKTVSADTAPTVVVIWSKYAGDRVAAEGVPPQDQPTEAETFKNTLLGAEPKFNGRLIFVEMAKPKEHERPLDWSAQLKTEIASALEDQQAVDILWAWEALVEESCSHVSEGLTAVAQAAIAGSQRQLKDGLKATLQHLAGAQGEGDFTERTAPGHLIAALTGLLADQLEHPAGIAAFAEHGAWLHQLGAPVSPDFASQMNGLLLTAPIPNASVRYVPGTVFRLRGPREFKKAFGKRLSALIDGCCERKRPHVDWRAWRQQATPVLIELSPVCDVAQATRISSLLVAGVIVPAAMAKQAKTKGSYAVMPIFRLRWPGPERDVALAYCHKYKITLPPTVQQSWLEPWFRLRDMPTAAIRNAAAAEAARVGFVSLG